MDRISTDEKLFEDEQEALRSALSDIANPKYLDNQLLPRYEWLCGRYHKLLKLTQRIFRISDSQGRVLQRHQSEIQNLLDNANQGFLTFGPDLKVNRQHSAECVRIFNRKISGVSILELFLQDEKDYTGVWSEVFAKAFLVPIDEGQALLGQLSTVIKIGEKDVRIECKLISQPVDHGEQILVMMILTDVTDKRRAEEHIHYLSYHDKLTSLYNRAYIETVLTELEKSEVAPFSVIVIDMNGLKLTNDVFGHTQGDKLLVAMAQVLLRSCGQTDIIARWGGDEFLVLLPRTDSSVCEQVCERIRLACSEVEETPIRLSAAIGTATREGISSGLAELFSVAENRMYSNKLAESREVRRTIILEMENKLHSRCFETIGHSERVRELVTGFAVFLGIGLDSAEMKHLNQLSAWHDIGKVAIPREILGKPGCLTQSEWAIVKSHSDIGYRMAQSIGEVALAEVVLTLHEHWDGSGYPSGLTGEQIPFVARVFSLADVYDVLTHVRPYGGAMSAKDALREIVSGSGSQFDPGLVGRFEQYMECNI